MHIDQEQALAILEVMLKEAATDFEGGVLGYLDAIKRERSAISAFKRAARQLITANRAKYNALCVVMAEYGFLTGKEEIKPPLENAETIVTELIMKIVASLDEETYKSVALQLIEERIEEEEKEK